MSADRRWHTSFRLDEIRARSRRAPPQRLNLTVRLRDRLLPDASRTVTVNLTDTDRRARSARVIRVFATAEILSLTVRLTPLESFAETVLSV